MRCYISQASLRLKDIRGLPVVLILLFGVSVSTWLWSEVFMLLGIFTTLEPALYFSWELY